MTPSEHLISRKDLARAAGVSPQAVSNWVARHQDFPSPVGRGAEQHFPVTAVARWLDRREIFADSLQPDEAKGATYGSRFRVATGIATPESAEEHDPPVDGLFAEIPWVHLAGRLSRGDEPAPVETEVLSLLCMRIVDPDGWRQLMAAEPVTFDALQRARGRLSRPLARATGVLDDPAVDLWRRARLIQLVRLVHSLVPSVSPQTFEHLLDRLAEYRGGSSGEYLMPPQLARLMVAMADPQPGDHIHDPCCGHGSLLVAAGRYLKTAPLEEDEPAVLTGRAATVRSHAVTTMNIAVNKVRPLINRDLSDDLSVVDVDPGPFDVVLLNPPFGRSAWRLPEAHAQRQWPYREPSPHSVAFAWVQAVAEALGPSGRAAVLMPASSMAPTTARERGVREKLLDRGVIRCIVELPGELFRETAVPVTVWILGPARSTGAHDVFLIDGRTAAARVGRTHRELTEQGCDAITELYRGMLAGSLPLPLDYEMPAAIVMNMSELRQRGYDLRPSVYLNHRPSAVAERMPADLRGLLDELIRLDAAAGVADHDLNEQLSRLAQWIR